MVRFIFICMIIVAVSVLSIAAQPLINGIGEAQQTLAERNSDGPLNEDVAAREQEELSPESLNDIETAAGATVDTGNADFGAPFTGTASSALEDSDKNIAPSAVQGTPGE